MPHNGSCLQVNPWFLYAGRDFAFINRIKQCGTWSFIAASGNPSPTTLTNQGFPTSVTNGGLRVNVRTPSSAQRPGEWGMPLDGRRPEHSNLVRQLAYH